MSPQLPWCEQRHIAAALRALHQAQASVDEARLSLEFEIKRQDDFAEAVAKVNTPEAAAALREWIARKLREDGETA